MPVKLFYSVVILTSSTLYQILD